MIIGTGSDISDIRRIERTFYKYGERFVSRVFTENEKQKAAKRSNPVPTYAKRFAAKEACAKALGTGVKQGVHFRDMGVENLPSGKPTMQLTGKALEKLHELTPPGMKAVIHLSISDEYPYAQAFVIIEAM